MAEKSPKEVYHFVTFRGPSAKGTSRTAAEKSQARSHAAKVTHSRRKANRGQTILKWIVEDQASLAETPKAKSTDPFVSYPHEALPPYLQSCLEYVYECVHPKLIAVASEEELGMVKSSWRRIGLEWPLMFHIQVAAAANLVRADPNHGPLPNKVEILRLKHQSRGLALVMAELKSLKGTASDGLLMAMVMVAMLTDPNQIPVPDTFRRSPLATAQNLHLYARLTVIPAMIEAMMGLVVKRGGIHNIKEYGMTQVLQFADLMLSSRLGIQPSFPWLYAPVRVLDLATYSPDQDAVLMSLVIATGFTQLDAVDLRLANLLREAGEVTVALDHYQQGRLNAPVLTDIVNAANSVQHRLLSMVPSSPLELHSNDFLRNMCRLAALIYSDLVLYPLPPSTEARPRLAKELSIAMEKFEVFKCEEVAQTDDPSDGDQYTNLVIWILMLGAFASTSTATSPFFINKLREYIARIPYLSDWPSFSNLMATYLWWEYIFAEPAAALWMEVCTFPQDPENSSSLFSGSYEQSQLSLGWSSNGPSIDAQDTDQTKHPGVSVQIISERSTLA